MTRIIVIGGSGYAGGHVVAEAVGRGHRVISLGRRLPGSPVPGAEYARVDVLDAGALHRAARDVDVIISALSPRGALAGRTRQAVADIAALATERGARLGVIGGAGSLRVGSDGPRVKDTDAVPPEFKAEAEEMSAVLQDLQRSDAAVDWFYLSPAAGFGSWAPGEATGVYRVGGEVLLVDDDGRSAISGADLAHAVLNEVETPRHRRAQFSVAY